MRAEGARLFANLSFPGAVRAISEPAEHLDNQVEIRHRL